MVCIMPKSINKGISTAVVTAATYTPTSVGYNQIKYTTQDPHDFEVGQNVSVLGITAGTSANISKLTIVNIPTTTSFIVSSSSVFATGTAPVIGTGTSAVTAYASNSMSGVYEIKYATPEPSTVSPYFLDITTNIQADIYNPYPTNGSVSVALNWSATGGSNPIAGFIITQTVGTTTTTLTSPSPMPGAGSTTITGLIADTVYTYSFVASNSFKVLPAVTSQITVPRLMYAMTSITASATASTANSISVSWVRPTVASPLPTIYELQKASSTNNTTWSAWTTIYDSGNNTSYVDTAVTNSVYYKYQVRAFNGSYNSYLESSSVLPYFITTPMTTPSLSTVSGVTANIVVNVSSYISNPTITQWTIDRSINGTTWSVLATTASLPYTDTTTAYSTQYYYRIRATNGQLTSAYSSSASITTNAQAVPTEYLVIAGGGGGAGGFPYANWQVAGGGGGAGGLRTNAGPSGGGASAEPAFAAVFGSTHSIQVGSYGNGQNGTGSAGVGSIFSTITTVGGGGGGARSSGTSGGSGGGGGGGNNDVNGGSPGTFNQGFRGGTSGNSYGGGGGGAGAVGTDNTGTYSKGGIGVLSSITGTSIGYAGGGVGGEGDQGSNPEATPVYNGVNYGGGTAASWGATQGGAGVANKGGGGGGASANGYNSYGGNGGSGIVILAYPNSYPALTVSGGLTHTVSTVSRAGYRVYSFTAGTGTVTFPS